MDFAMPMTNPSKKQKFDPRPNFQTSMEIFSKVAQIAVSYGCEMLTCGAAIQVKNAIETNGSLYVGNL